MEKRRGEILTEPAASSNAFWTLIWSSGETGAAITYLTPKPIWFLIAAGDIKKKKILKWTHWQEVKGAAKVIFPETQTSHYIWNERI